MDVDASCVSLGSALNKLTQLLADASSQPKATTNISERKSLRTCCVLCEKMINLDAWCIGYYVYKGKSDLGCMCLSSILMLAGLLVVVLRRRRAI